MDDVLLFTGTRWGGAKVVDRRQVVIGRTDTNPNGKVLFDTTLIIETTGEGRVYSVDSAEAWWRDFSEIPFADEKLVLSFLRRRGDPLGLLAPGRQISTCDWYPLSGVLRAAATLWDPQPDAGGVSHFHPEDLPVVQGLFDSKRGWPWGDSVGILRNGIPGHHAKTLASYMWESAAAALRNRRPMRRCDYCSSWFTLNRSDARWCSRSCRAASSNQRKYPHAVVS